MDKEFQQIQWDDHLRDDCSQIVHLAVREDLGRWHDLTTLALLPAERQARAAVVTRQDGIICGLLAAEQAIRVMETSLTWMPKAEDGDAVNAGAAVAEIQGSARDLLTAERLMLNLIGRLSGVASKTNQYVRAVSGTRAQIYDTRKTTPGWRRLEKYAVRCGGGRNHRTGLFDAVLIKDNHLGMAGKSPGEAVDHAREFLAEMLAGESGHDMIVEIEVDTLDQFEDVLPHQPDIVLLDNMSPEQLRDAVARRDSIGSATELEASGGINSETLRSVAESGVDRISVGALTHSAASLDVGLDWLSGD